MASDTRQDSLSRSTTASFASHSSSASTTDPPSPHSEGRSYSPSATPHLHPAHLLPPASSSPPPPAPARRSFESVFLQAFRDVRRAEKVADSRALATEERAGRH